MSTDSVALARTIPGLRRAKGGRSAAGLGPKEPGSAALNGRHIAAGLDTTYGRLLLLLPTDAEGWRTLLYLSVAYACVFISLAVVHIPSCVNAGPWWRATNILWKHLRSDHLGHWLLYGPLLAFLSCAEGLFDRAENRRLEYLLRVAKVAFWTTLVFGLGLHLSGVVLDPYELLRQATILIIAMVTVSVLTEHLGHGFAACNTEKNVLVVGTPRAACEVARSLARVRNGGRVVKGFITTASEGPAAIARLADLGRIARAEFIDEVIIAAGEDRRLGERALVEALRNRLDVSIVPEFFSQRPVRPVIERVGAVPLIKLHEERLPRAGLVIKRLLDLGISSIALLSVLPFMLVIALAIRLDSPGPVLYRALRAGRKGKTFVCYKFRTMYIDAPLQKEALRSRNERLGPTFKITNDPRITPIGRILRRYSLDELPQLWNVFTGSMSIVGPRPHPLDDYERYSLEDRRRLDVSPGITGLWQVTARHDPSFAINVALDLEYIEKWSLGLDFAILMKTIAAVLAGTGA